TAIGTANVEVGGGPINVGQQSVSVRGVGLTGGGEPAALPTSVDRYASDYRQAVGGDGVPRDRKLADIEHVVLGSQPGGIPIMVRDVAKVAVGYLPRLGRAGRDDDDDVTNGTVVMSRVLHTNEVLPRVKA